MAATKNTNEMHEHRIKVLKAVASGGNTTIASLTKRTKLSDRAAYHAVYHLREDGFISPKVLDVDGKKENHYTLTAKGRKAL